MLWDARCREAKAALEEAIHGNDATELQETHIKGSGERMNDFDWKQMPLSQKIMGVSNVGIIVSGILLIIFRTEVFFFLLLMFLVSAEASLKSYKEEKKKQEMEKENVK